MRVLRLSHSAVVDSWRARERALRDLGVEVELLSAQSWDEGGADVPLSPRPNERVSGVRTWGKHPALFLYDPRPLWRAMGETWDVIDIHEEPFALATAETLLLRWLRRQSAPYTLYSAQNLDKHYPPPFGWLERWSLCHAAGISVCNKAAGQIAGRKGFPGVPSVIPLGIDVQQFAPPADPHEARDPGRIRVGYVGRLAEHKGVAVLIDAIAGDGRMVLDLAGAGPMENQLRDHSRRLGVESRVRFLGSMAHHDLPGFYAGLDVLAVPSLTTQRWVEQFGRVAVEAMACRVPVVASDSGALPDVVGAAGRLVRPDDPEALRDALATLGTDIASADRARTAGLALASRCSWERVASDYLHMYEAAVHRPRFTAERPVEVIVIAYGAPDLFRRALESVRGLPVTVVDNSSSPDVKQICAELGVPYLDPGHNLGFAAGVNRALAHRQLADADVLLLNPDAMVSVATITVLQRALAADRHLASVGPVQVDAQGVRARVGWPFPSPVRAWLEALGLGRLRDRTDFVIGSVLLLRSEALAHVGKLDERFFLYAEETDWAYRASRLGWRHAVVPTARAIHEGGATSRDADRRERHFHASQERYLRKHFGTWGWQLARAGQLCGAAIRALVLPGARRQPAKERFRLYLTGPVRAERRLPQEPERAPVVSTP